MEEPKYTFNNPQQKKYTHFSAGRRKDISDSRERIYKVPEAKESKTFRGAGRLCYGGSQDSGWLSP